MEMNSLMPHYNPLQDFPSSRDYNLPNFPCTAKKCISNVNGVCICPSLAEIGEDGKCIHFKEKSK